jgi:hypothetical protein
MIAMTAPFQPRRDIAEVALYLGVLIAGLRLFGLLADGSTIMSLSHFCIDYGLCDGRGPRPEHAG